MRAFTLVETLIVIAIVGTAGLALNTALVDFYRQNTYVFESTTALENSRRALQVSLQNLREASYGEDGAYPLLAVATSSITFHSDVDGDAPVENVRLYLSGQTFYRAVTNPSGNPPSYTGLAATSTVISYIRNTGATPIFRYFNDAGIELTGAVDISEVSQIQVHIDIDINPNRAPEIFTLTGRSTLRNVIHH